MQKLLVLAFFLAVHLQTYASEQQSRSQADLSNPLEISTEAYLLNERSGTLGGAQGVGGSYSLAPFVEDVSTAFYLSSVAAPTVHTFDDTNESGGDNFFGTAGGSILIIEGVVPQGDGVDRYIVEVSTRNSALNLEPWVDVSWAGNGLIYWRLDVGSTLGGNDPIEFAFPIAVVNSGFFVFDSSGTLLGAFNLYANTSTPTSLSGVAILNNSGFDIAGVDVAAIQMFWDVTLSEPVDLALQIVDAEDGAYTPGSSLNVFVAIENVGGSPSDSSSFDLYASTDTTITTDDRLIGSFIAPSIGPGETSSGNAPTTLPGDLTNG